MPVNSYLAHPKIKCAFEIVWTPQRGLDALFVSCNRSGMTITEFLDHAGMSGTQFAAMIGRSKSFVSRLNNGKAAPSLETLQSIQRVTGGLVTASDFRVNKTTRQG